MKSKNEPFVINIYNKDCMELMASRPDNYYDLAITDPPYGIDGNSHRENKSRGKLAHSKDYHPVLWSQDVPQPEYFDELFRVSKNQIIWGINYFTPYYSFGAGRVIWDKVNGSSSFSDCEIAYSSFHDSVRMFTFMWNGMMQGKSISEGYIMQGDKAKNEKRIHPTQKPVKLYQWLLKKYAKEGDKILDTHLGSGSIGIACHDLGFSLDATEIDKVHFNDANKRIKEHQAQLELFK